MIGNHDAVAMVAVRDIKAAAKFYEEVLGLRRAGGEGEEVITYKSGNSRLNVYRSQYAGTNKATAVTWSVGGELMDIVGALKSKGVKFEHYDMPGMKRDGDVYGEGNMRVAWFKDPDGNILSLVGG